MTDDAKIREAKALLRAEARARRRALADKDGLSREIARRVEALPEYRAARTILFYVDLPDEVRTRPLLLRALESGKTVVVPYCHGPELRLVRLTSLDELCPGTYGVHEPRSELRTLADRYVEPPELDLVLVPGVAFDPFGARLGQGAGYYDRFLPNVSVEVPLIGLAFECQVFPDIPSAVKDVPMNRVVTESDVYPKLDPLGPE